MKADLAQELLDELGSSIENLETQQTALLQFLKDNGLLTDDQFAPYLAQAGKASGVRWRAARIRLERLFSTELQKEEKREEKEQPQTDAEQASTQNQKQESPNKSGVGNADAAPQGGEAGTKAAVENDSEKTTAEKNDHQHQHPTGEDKNPGLASKIT